MSRLPRQIKYDSRNDGGGDDTPRCNIGRGLLGLHTPSSDVPGNLARANLPHSSTSSSSSTGILSRIRDSSSSSSSVRGLQAVQRCGYQQETIRHPRAAKTQALELLIGNQSDTSDDSVVESEQSETGDEVEVEVQSEDLDNIPEDDDFDEEIVHWHSSGEDSDSDDIPKLPPFPQPVELSPDGREWRKGLPKNAIGRQPKENVFRGMPGTVKHGIHPESEKDALLVFTNDLIQNAVMYTNLQGRRTVGRCNQVNKQKTWRKTDTEEMEAFFGLLLIAGAYKAHYRSTAELWSQKEGHPIFPATMSRNRFKELKRNLRFDDPLRRDGKDPLAPIRDVTTSFITHLRDHVVAPEYLCVDEQLLEFHGRVRFRQYIPSKPGKFGIKIFWLTDSAGAYCFNGLFYLGAATLSDSEKSQSSSFPEAVVMNLTKPFLNNGRHITADNWFSSISLTQRLLECATTYVGTCRRNQRSLPPSLKSTAGRHHGDVIFAHNDDMILVSFWDKGPLPVILVDSLHRGNEIVEGKPSTVTFYNATKSGVDVLDRKIRAFTCKRKCRRWPVGAVCNLFDIACINGMYLMQQTRIRPAKTYHYDFVKNAGYQLVDNHIKRRMTKGDLKLSVRTAMKMVGYNLQESTPICLPLTKPRRCQLCPHARDQKTKNTCVKCSKAICGSHRAMICLGCVE